METPQGAERTVHTGPCNKEPWIRPRVFRVDRRDIGYLRFTLESYDGMAVVSTIDPYVALIDVRIAPGCEETVHELLDFLKHGEGLDIEKEDPCQDFST